MVNYWVFKFCPSSGILKTELRLALSKGPNGVGVSPPTEDGNRSSF
jgi:hypothetical protein